MLLHMKGIICTIIMVLRSKTSNGISKGKAVLLKVLFPKTNIPALQTKRVYVPVSIGG